MKKVFSVFKRSILVAIILSLGRTIGETIAVMNVIGNSLMILHF